MKVYRLERNGFGPFISSTYYRLPHKASKHKRKRVAHELSQAGEGKNRAHRHWKAVYNDYLFGAPTKELLKAYFGYDLKRFFALGYKIKVYEVPSNLVIHMGNEVAFPVKYHKFRTVRKLKKHMPA